MTKDEIPLLDPEELLKEFQKIRGTKSKVAKEDFDTDELIEKISEHVRVKNQHYRMRTRDSSEGEAWYERNVNELYSANIEEWYHFNTTEWNLDLDDNYDEGYFDQPPPDIYYRFFSEFFREAIEKFVYLIGGFYLQTMIEASEEFIDRFLCNFLFTEVTQR